MSRLILSVDTATTAGSVAVLHEKKILGELFVDTQKTHSERVLKTINFLLSELNLSINDFELFVASIGPGSFTGIRIGLSILKGFACALNKKLLGISAIDALATEYKGNGKFLAFIEGRAGEIFYAFFEKNNNLLKRLSDYKSENFLKLATNDNNYGIFKSKEIEKFAEKGYLFAHNFALFALEHQDNYKKDNITPLYIKPSDAEINFKKCHPELVSGSSVKSI